MSHRINSPFCRPTWCILLGKRVNKKERKQVTPLGIVPIEDIIITYLVKKLPDFMTRGGFALC